MPEDGSEPEGAAGPLSKDPGAMLPSSPRDDQALWRACQCFGDALGRFIELRRAVAVDPEAVEKSDTTRLAAARSKWSDALSEVSGLRATTWGGLQARYEAWFRLEFEFGEDDGRVFELAVDLVRNTYALAWENSDDWISARRNAPDFASTNQERSAFSALLSRVGGSLPVFPLRGRRSQT